MKAATMIFSLAVAAVGCSKAQLADRYEVLPWGKESYGLQCAFTSNKTVYQPGDKITFIVHICNKRDVPVYLKVEKKIQVIFSKPTPRKMGLEVRANIHGGECKIPRGGVLSFPVGPYDCLAGPTVRSDIAFSPGKYTYVLACRPLFSQDPGYFTDGADNPDELRSQPVSFEVSAR